MSEVNVEPVIEAEVEAEVEPRDYEGEAKNMGWHNPENEDYIGDKEKALSAEDFVKKGENELPVLRANMRKLQKKIDANDADKEEFKAYMNSQLDKEKTAHEALKRQAVEDGDTALYDKLNENAPKEAAKETPKESDIEIAFKSRNEWYGVDEKRTQLAMNVDHEFRALRNVLSTTEYAEKVERRIEELMPSKAAHNTVTSGRKKLGKSTAKTFEGMPKENQEACKRMEKNNWGIDRKEYVKNYYEGEE